MTDSQNSIRKIEFKITPLDDEVALDLTVSSSKHAEKNLKLKRSTEPQSIRQNAPISINDPLIVTTPTRNPANDNKRISTPISVQDIMDTKAVGEPPLVKTEGKTGNILQDTKEAILNRFNDVLAIEKSMMREIIEKDTEREKFMRELMVKLELLQRENQILTAENKSLKEMMALWKISG